MFNLEKIHLLIIHSLMLLALHLVFGKKASFPYGIMVGFFPTAIGLVITALDFALIYLVAEIFENTTRIKIFRKWKEMEILKSEKMKSTKRFRYFNHLGKIGLVGVVIVPFTGGIYSAYFLGNMLKLSKKASYLLTCLGAILGNLLFALSSMGLLHWIR